MVTVKAMYIKYLKVLNSNDNVQEGIPNLVIVKERDSVHQLYMYLVTVIARYSIHPKRCDSVSLCTVRLCSIMFDIGHKHVYLLR